VKRATAGLLALTVAACGDSSPPPLLNDDLATDAEAAVTNGMVFGPAPAPGDDPATCEDAAQLRSYVGCDYWPTVVANDVWSIFDFAVVVANAGAAPASVTITGPGGTNQARTVQPNTLEKFYLPWVAALKGADSDTCGSAVGLSASVVVPGGAYHLVSSVPVTVYQFNALEYAGTGGPSGKSWTSCPGLRACTDPTSPGYGQAVGCFSFTNDSSLLFPSTAMTGNYRVTAYPGQTVPASDAGPAQPFMGSYFAITATVDSTHVRVQLSSSGQVLAGGGIVATGAGGEVDLTLDAGDVAELAGAPGDTVDLSGSLVAADHPVQVIAGAPCDEIPEGAPACDHLEQSVFPAETLGTNYFVTLPMGPTGRAVGHVVRFYGNADDTTLAYAPAAPPGCPTDLTAGQVADCGIVDTNFQVTGTHEFGVGSFMLGGSIVDPAGGLGDPSESLIASVEQYRTKYVFLAPDDYEVNAVDIVTPMGAEVALDQLSLNTSLATPIAGGFGVLHVSLGGVNPGGLGAHLITSSEPVGLQVLGYGSFTSYQYPGGLNLKQIAPAPLLQ
jgi:hypothetical protein